MKGRRFGVALTVLGGIALISGVVGVTGLWCPTGLISCPASGPCTSGPPACPSPLDYVLFATIVVIGVGMAVSGRLFLRQSKKA